uniref:Putative secreted protein n=1 Tax=Anopheles triannulatus TaxID=58253 RepID=A0A2M4B268_9DIPT
MRRRDTAKGKTARCVSLCYVRYLSLSVSFALAFPCAPLCKEHKRYRSSGILRESDGAGETLKVIETIR